MNDSRDNHVYLCSDRMVHLVDTSYYLDKEGWIHDDRILSFNVFLLILNGKFHVTEEGVPYTLEKGDIFFLKAGMHHWGDVPCEKGTDWYWIHFFDNVCDDCDTDRNCSYFNNRQIGNSIEKIQLPKKAKIENIETLTGMIKELRMAKDPITKNVTTYRILYEVYKTVQAQEKSPSSILAEKIADFLEDNVLKDCSSDHIAEVMGMNYQYLSRIFTQYYGISISQYRNTMKIKRAIKFLKDTNMNITQIADILNFQNVYYFSRVFKKVVGISPREYMKQIYR